MTLCECGDSPEQHDDDGAGVCLAELPAWPELELPAYRCPCRRYVAGPWRWHAPTQSWTLPRAEPAA